MGAMEVEFARRTYALEQIGLTPVTSTTISTPYQNWNGTPEQRAQQIIDALHTPGIRAIHSLEGGQGAEAVVAELRRREAEKPGLLTRAPNRGIPLIGYSDTTFLQQYLGEIGAVSPVQGPPLAYLATNDKYIVNRNGEYTVTAV
ncbi:MAG: LD-carboxypeptidase, partial [Rickettsiales bacterium]|nr:LD-carboxypeptidase [Rickettsiales bacterium]